MRHARLVGGPAPIPPARSSARPGASSCPRFGADTAIVETTRAATEAQRSRGTPPPHFLIPPGEAAPSGATLPGLDDVDTSAGKPVAIGAVFLFVALGIALWGAGIAAAAVLRGVLR